MRLEQKQLVDMPRLETERLILRSWYESDLDCISEILSDEDNARYVGGMSPYWKTWRSFASIIGHFYMRGFTFFAIEDKKTGETIGWAGPWFPGDWPEPEIGYSLKKSTFGQGFGLEAARAALRYVYQELKWPTAISLINPSNKPSQHLAQKLGASCEGKFMVHDVEEVDIWRHMPPQDFLKH